MMCAAEKCPNSHTFVFVLKACSRLRAGEEGEQIHGSMIKLGAEREIFPSNALISMYAACRRIQLSTLVFDTCLLKDEVSWNALLTGYLNCGLLDNATKLFDEMPTRGIVSWNAMINGYAQAGDLAKARKLFDKMPKRDVESWNTMIAGYARCDCLNNAMELFDLMPTRNAISWSVMISACTQGGNPGAALTLFREMQQRHLYANWAAIVSVLSACSSLSNLAQGKLVHEYIKRNKMKVDGILGTVLIDMYSKCGCVDGATAVFNDIESHDVFDWTAMIGGLAANGQSEKALELFEEMLTKKIEPNAVTFVGVLWACSQLGDANLARKYFESMKAKHGIDPEVEHYGCLVDALGRAGMVGEAAAVAEVVPGGGAAMWGTLLGVCSSWGDMKGGEYAANRLAELGDSDSGEYVMMANLLAGKGQWEKAKQLRELMKDRGISKYPGRSFIEVDC